jgi:hypothetical protein
LKTQDLGPKIVESAPGGNTRMISSIIKDIREQKKMLVNNQKLQNEFEKSVGLDLYNVAEPNLHQAGESFAVETLQKPLGTQAIVEDHPLLNL